MSAPAVARDQLDPLSVRDIIVAVVGLRATRLLKRMVASIAHGPASSHYSSPPEINGRGTFTLGAFECRSPQLPRGAVPLSTLNVWHLSTEIETRRDILNNHLPSSQITHPHRANRQAIFTPLTRPLLLHTRMEQRNPAAKEIDMPGEIIEIREIPIAATRVPDGMRRVGSAIEGAQLAESIAAEGVLQPITVTPDPNDDTAYVMIDGVARLDAVRLAGGSSITAIVVRGKNASALRVIVNLVRADAHAVDLAHMVEAAIQEGMSRAELMAALGKSPSWISDNMTIARIPRDVIASILAREPDITRDQLIRFARELKGKAAWRLVTRARPLRARQRAKENAAIESVTALVCRIATQLHAVRDELAETVEPALRIEQKSALEDLRIALRALARIVGPVLRELNRVDDDQQSPQFLSTEIGMHAV